MRQAQDDRAGSDGEELPGLLEPSPGDTESPACDAPGRGAPAVVNGALDLKLRRLKHTCTPLCSPMIDAHFSTSFTRAFVGEPRIRVTLVDRLRYWWASLMEVGL